MKSVKMFGKKIPILAILVIVMISGAGVYGAIVNYLSSTIVTDTVVESPIAIKGKLTYWPADRGFFTTASGGVAEWSSEESKTGYSAKLSVSVPADEARLAFSHDGLLKDVDDIIYNSYVQGWGGGQHPAVVLGLDTDGDGGQDAWVVQWECPTLPPNGEDTWIETTFSGATYVHVAGTRTGLPGEDYVAHFEVIEELDTLDELIAETFEDSVTWGDLPVVRIKIFLGEVTGLDETITAYVDDVSGAVNSGCEPESVNFGETATPISVRGGSEFYMDFDLTNLANQEMETTLGLLMVCPSEWTVDDPIAEIADLTYPDYSGLHTGNDLILGYDLGTTYPDETDSYTVWVKFAPDVQPETYTIKGTALWTGAIPESPDDIAYIFGAMH